MTKDEFEKGYAERSGLTVEELHKMGGFAQPCDCEYSGCQGWAMMFGDSPLFLFNASSEEAL